MIYMRRFCRACARRMRFLVNCVRMGPSNAAWVHDYEATEDRGT